MTQAEGKKGKYSQLPSKVKFHLVIFLSRFLSYQPQSLCLSFVLGNVGNLVGNTLIAIIKANSYWALLYAEHCFLRFLSLYTPCNPIKQVSYYR